MGPNFAIIFVTSLLTLLAVGISNIVVANILIDYVALKFPKKAAELKIPIRSKPLTYFYAYNLHLLLMFSNRLCLDEKSCRLALISKLLYLLTALIGIPLVIFLLLNIPVQ